MNLDFLTLEERQAICLATRDKQIELLNSLAYQLHNPFNKDVWGLLPRVNTLPQHQILQLIKALCDIITPLSPEDQP